MITIPIVVALIPVIIIHTILIHLLHMWFRKQSEEHNKVLIIIIHVIEMIIIFAIIAGLTKQ